jgi:hypothetical protein
VPFTNRYCNWSAGYQAWHLGVGPVYTYLPGADGQRFQLRKKLPDQSASLYRSPPKATCPDYQTTDTQFRLNDLHRSGGGWTFSHSSWPLTGEPATSHMPCVEVRHARALGSRYDSLTQVSRTRPAGNHIPGRCDRCDTDETLRHRAHLPHPRPHHPPDRWCGQPSNRL